MATVVYGDFEWEARKAESNEAKHGVSFEEATLALLDPRSVDIVDAFEPERLVTIGRAANGVLTVVSTDRRDRTRIISARKATPHEKRIYEKD